MPEVMRIGQARLTAGLDRFARIGLREHEEIFGSLRRMDRGAAHRPCRKR